MLALAHAPAAAAAAVAAGAGAKHQHPLCVVGQCLSTCSHKKRDESCSHPRADRAFLVCSLCLCGKRLRSKGR
jgi:hypothetical protein